MITLNDILYGASTIDAPIVAELLESPALQRLAGIDQGGYSRAFFPGAEHTRLDHSIGVFLLLRRYNAPLEEQIAGLIHDVSHSAFSHCVDYILQEGSEKEHSHQDAIFAEFIETTDIPAICQRHHLSLEYLMDDNNFPLKETVLPDLCADRIDYSLRTAYMAGVINGKELFYILDSLIVDNNIWAFRNRENAQVFADLFLKLNREYFAGLSSAVMFRTVGDYIKYALGKGYIHRTDVYTTDNVVLKKIAAHHTHDPHLSDLFRRMNNDVPHVNDPQDFEAHVWCKSRIVDPFYLLNGGVHRLSDAHPAWKEIILQESSPKEYFIRFL